MANTFTVRVKTIGYVAGERLVTNIFRLICREPGLCLNNSLRSLRCFTSSIGGSTSQLASRCACVGGGVVQNIPGSYTLYVLNKLTKFYYMWIPRALFQWKFDEEAD